MLIVNSILHICVSYCSFVELVGMNCERIQLSHSATSYIKHFIHRIMVAWIIDNIKHQEKVTLFNGILSKSQCLHSLNKIGIHNLCMKTS